jgi:hypothetical protein
MHVAEGPSHPTSLQTDEPLRALGCPVLRLTGWLRVDQPQYRCWSKPETGVIGATGIVGSRTRRYNNALHHVSTRPPVHPFPFAPTTYNHHQYPLQRHVQRSPRCIQRRGGPHQTLLRTGTSLLPSLLHQDLWAITSRTNPRLHAYLDPALQNGSLVLGRTDHSRVLRPHLPDLLADFSAEEGWHGRRGTPTLQWPGLHWGGLLRRRESISCPGQGQEGCDARRDCDGVRCLDGTASDSSCLNCIIMGVRCPLRRLTPEYNLQWAETVGLGSSQAEANPRGMPRCPVARRTLGPSRTALRATRSCRSTLASSSSGAT